MHIIGQKINLRFPTLDDVASITKYGGEKEISEFTFIPYPYTEQDAIEFIESSFEERQQMKTFNVAIENNETNELIGMIGLNVINKNHKKAEVGYWIAKPFWGTGRILEALNLMVAYCFSELDIERVYAFVNTKNIGSWKLLEKAKFEREGLLKKLMIQHNERQDHFIYAILKK